MIKKTRENRLYNIWYAMTYACSSEKSASYPYNGARGVGVYWTKYESFHRWAKRTKYKAGMYLVRIDKKKDWVPSNLKWSTSRGGSNCRNPVNPWGLGEMSINEAVKKYSKLSRTGVRARLEKGLSIEQALSQEEVK